MIRVLYRLRAEIRISGRETRRVVPDEDGVLVLQERGAGHVFLDGVTDREVAVTTLSARLGERELDWSHDRNGFELPLDKAYWVGELPLVIRVGEDERAHRVRIDPDSRKSELGDWMRMLRQLEDWLAGVTAGREGGRLGSISGTGVMSAPWLSEALVPLVPALTRVLREVSARPHRCDEYRPCEVPLRNATRISGETVRWIGRRPSVAQWLIADEISGSEPLVLQRETLATIDHPANRHVCWLVRGIVSRLEQLEAQLREISARPHSSITDTAMWCDARAERLADELAELKREWRASPLRVLRPEPAAQSGAGVLMGRPAYARVAQIGRRLLSPWFSPAASPDRATGDLAASVRPSFELYELWTFFLVARSLQLCTADWTWLPADLEPLRSIGDTGEGARVSARSADGRSLDVRFNRTFRKVRTFEDVLAGRRADVLACCSLSTRRRPDITVSCGSSRGGRWVCLDAKYTVSRSLAGAMEKLHIYRDSLWMDEYGGRCRAALLLAPTAGTTPWGLPDYRDRFDIGLWECTPGMAPSRELGAWILEKLDQPT